MNQIGAVSSYKPDFDVIAKIRLSTVWTINDLIDICGLDPRKDFKYVNLIGVDWAGTDREAFDLTGSNEEEFQHDDSDDDDYHYLEDDDYLVYIEDENKDAKSSSFLDEGFGDIPESHKQEFLDNITEFYGSDFRTQVLDNLDFSLSSFEQSDFSETFARSAIFHSCNLRYCNFANADLSSADLSFSDISESDFSGVRLSNTVLTGVKCENTIFFGTDLSSAQGVTSKMLSLAIGNSKTILPSGITRPKHWPR